MRAFLLGPTLARQRLTKRDRAGIRSLYRRARRTPGARSWARTGEVALDDENSNPDEGGRRVLLAEDSSVTSDLIRLILSQRGHRVDLREDGEGALAALLAEPYDTALIDFHLPLMNGLEVVTRFLAEHRDAPRPYLVAITGDTDGLLADSADRMLFDRVVPKPLDIDLVCRLVEGESGKSRETAAETAEDGSAEAEVGAPEAPSGNTVGLEPRPPPPKATVGKPSTDAIETLDFAFIRCRAGGEPEPEPGLTPAEHDAVLLYEPSVAAGLWSMPGVHLLPVIDMTGVLGASADLDATALRLGDIGAVDELVRAFYARRAELHADLVGSSELGDRLLGRIHASGGTLRPRLHGATPCLIAWNTVLDPAVVLREVTRLAAEDMLSLAFFDRLHHCPACGSARLNVREECVTCRSSQLAEDSYLHHFRCAFQGPESDFHRDGELVCPKCRRTLRHFGSEYDRPGTMTRCGACGASTSEPAVGFVCADCGTRTDADAMPVHDICTATLTDHAEGYLRAGRSFLGLASRTLRFADLPIALVVALNAAAREFNASGTEFSLAHIAYANSAEIARAEGPRQLARARGQFLRSLGDTLGPDAQLERGGSHDFALVRGTEPGEFRDRFDIACAEAQSGLRFDLGARAEIVGPREIAT